MMFEKNVEEKTGKKGQHNLNWSGSGYSHEQRSIVLGGCKVEVLKPPGLVRSTVKKLRSRRTRRFKNGEILVHHALGTMLHSLSTPNYAFGLEGVGDVEASGISKSSMSSRFARMTQEALAELIAKPVDEIELVVLYSKRINNQAGCAT